MVVGGEQSLRSQPPGVGGVFQNGTGNGHAVVSRGSPADFIQNQQAPGGGVFQNRGDLRHLHHEGGLAGSQVVAGADTGEDPVYETDFRGPGGYKGAHLGHEHDEGHLPHVGGFTRHIGAGDDGHLIVFTAQIGVVGHEQSVLEHRLHHRMPSVGDGNFPPEGNFRAAVAPLHRNSGEGTQHVGGGYRLSGKLHPGCLLGQVFPEPGENLVFQCRQPVFRGEHLIFQLFQLLGDVAFAVGKGLLTDVGFRHLIHKGLGYFNIIAKYSVKAHFQGTDAGFLPLAGFNGGNGAAAALHNVPEPVGFGVRALADDAALPDSQGRVVHDGAFDQIGTVGEGVNSLFQFLQQRCAAALQLPLHLRQGTEATGKA